MPVENPVFDGAAWGSGYSATLAEAISRREYRVLARKIDCELKTIDAKLSLWRPDSELCRLNAWKSTEYFPLSPPLSALLREALEISQETGGAFDPTIGPCMALWGFGPHGECISPPDEATIAEIRRRVGWRQISLVSNSVSKAHPQIELDLNAVADGFAADRVSALLRSAGHTNHLVEVGGEVVAEGTGPRGIPWQIGIESPDPRSLPGTAIWGVVRLSNQAMATSGSYRDWRWDRNGHAYAHILDPRRGRPVRSRTASVSVIAKSGVRADGIATALFVMGPEEGLPWVEGHSDIEALFLLRQPDGTILEISSRGFSAATAYGKTLPAPPTAPMAPQTN